MTTSPFSGRMATSKPWLWLLYGIPRCRNGIQPLHCSKIVNVPAKGYISDQLTDEGKLALFDRAKTLLTSLCVYLAYNAPHLPMIILHRSNIRSNLIPVVKTVIITTLPFILLIRCKTHSRTNKEKRQYDNTIILFNGAVIDVLPLNGAQKGYKSQTYPGGTTPQCLCGEENFKLVFMTSWFPQWISPTALDAADISIPKDLKLDGVSLHSGCKIRNKASHIKSDLDNLLFSLALMRKIFHSGIILTNKFVRHCQTITRITPTLRT